MPTFLWTAMYVMSLRSAGRSSDWSTVTDRLDGC